ERLGLGGARLSGINLDQVIAGSAHIGVVWAAGLLLRQHQDALVDGLGLAGAALALLEKCQAVERRSQPGIIGASRLLQQRHLPAAQRLGLGQTLLLLVTAGEFA